MSAFPASTKALLLSLALALLLPGCGGNSPSATPRPTEAYKSLATTERSQVKGAADLAAVAWHADEKQKNSISPSSQDSLLKLYRSLLLRQREYHKQIREKLKGAKSPDVVAVIKRFEELGLDPRQSEGPVEELSLPELRQARAAYQDAFVKLMAFVGMKPGKQKAVIQHEG